MDLLERAQKYDVAVSRAQEKKKNNSTRQMCGAFEMSDRQFVKRYRLSKEPINYRVGPSYSTDTPF